MDTMCGLMVNFAINETEAKIVRWIFDRYLAGDSLGKITTGLEQQGIPSPMGKAKWNREGYHQFLSNEKYTGSVLLQKNDECLRHTGSKRWRVRKGAGQEPSRGYHIRQRF